jgi:hypothetical protein
MALQLNSNSSTSVNKQAPQITTIPASKLNHSQQLALLQQLNQRKQVIDLNSLSGVQILQQLPRQSVPQQTYSVKTIGGVHQVVHHQRPVIQQQHQRVIQTTASRVPTSPRVQMINPTPQPQQRVIQSTSVLPQSLIQNPNRIQTINTTLSSPGIQIGNQIIRLQNLSTVPNQIIQLRTSSGQHQFIQIRQVAPASRSSPQSVVVQKPGVVVQKPLLQSNSPRTVLQTNQQIVLNSPTLQSTQLPRVVNINDITNGTLFVSSPNQSGS